MSIRIVTTQTADDGEPRCGQCGGAMVFGPSTTASAYSCPKCHAPFVSCGECRDGAVFVGAVYVGPCPKCNGGLGRAKA